MNPEYMDPLYHTSAGHKLIVLGLVMMAVGSRSCSAKSSHFRG